MVDGTERLDTVLTVEYVSRITNATTVNNKALTGLILTTIVPSRWNRRAFVVNFVLESLTSNWISACLAALTRWMTCGGNVGTESWIVNGTMLGANEDPCIGGDGPLDEGFDEPADEGPDLEGLAGIVMVTMWFFGSLCLQVVFLLPMAGTNLGRYLPVCAAVIS